MRTEPQIRFLTTSDGARMAYSALGTGPAIVRTPPGISHLDLEWKIPQIRTFFERLAQHHTVVRYDSHGCGLSDRNRCNFSVAAEVGLLELVVDSLDLEQTALFGYGAGGPVCGFLRGPSSGTGLEPDLVWNPR
jgi:pimeloyl-ACP methyl ester carboxylesterase